MRLVVGLGNPGPEYAWTRHNIGWLVLDQVIQHFSLGKPSLKYDGMFWGPRKVGVTDCLFLKPLTYMNLSGRAVSQVCRYYHIEPEFVLVVSDDVALPFGRLRLRIKGSAGGHNGLASVLGALGTLDVPRLRLGVGAVPMGRDMVSWVLGTFPSHEREQLPEFLHKAANAVELWLTEESQLAMSQINSRDNINPIKGLEEK
ncbi:aminoacyl-tRNA hydrolase [Aminobacterium mobile]|uniref:aminoacyl-tRNA hydrolase n=1 Tax=Aminobacterium mobile TaxID=81467 RepID=UPI003315192B